jgi:hypothetical protein
MRLRLLAAVFCRLWIDFEYLPTGRFGERGGFYERCFNPWLCELTLVARQGWQGASHNLGCQGLSSKIKCRPRAVRRSENWKRDAGIFRKFRLRILWVSTNLMGTPSQMGESGDEGRPMRDKALG